MTRRFTRQNSSNFLPSYILLRIIHLYLLYKSFPPPLLTALP